MKSGKTLQELAIEIQRQAEAKRDFIAPAASLRFETQSTGESFVEMPTNGHKEAFAVADTAHDQFAAKLDIPRKYYDRLRTEAPRLLDTNVNHWLQASKEKQMIRTMDGRIRACLSDKYRPLDNFDLASVVLPVVKELNVIVLSAEITESRFYLKIVDSKIQQDIPKGAKLGDGSHVIFDTLSPAMTISNSEIGHGALAILAGIFTKQCTNLATFSQRSMRKYHTGARAQLDEGTYELLSNDTKMQSDKAIWMQTRDLVKAAFDRARFDALVEQVKGSSNDAITADPVKVIEVTAKRFNMTETERGNVLSHLIKGGDLSRYGLFNAITRTAEDLDSYDRATEFEKLGGEVIELNASEWKSIAVAA